LRYPLLCIDCLALQGRLAGGAEEIRIIEGILHHCDIRKNRSSDY
jgi:hypothetical protein